METYRKISSLSLVIFITVSDISDGISSSKISLPLTSWLSGSVLQKGQAVDKDKEKEWTRLLKEKYITMLNLPGDESRTFIPHLQLTGKHHGETVGSLA